MCAILLLPFQIKPCLHFERHNLHFCPSAQKEFVIVLIQQDRWFLIIRGRTGNASLGEK